jgi:alpha-beta hydrolase superfamily lysophospholipase
MNFLSLLSGTRAVRLLTLAGAMAAVLMAGCAHLEQKERELVFRIEPGQARWFGGMPQGVQELNLPVPGRAEHLHAIWWPARDPEAPAMLYLHGARWNITGQMFRIEQLREFGFSVLAVDYRGFGKSAGDLPSEQTVYEDARIAWEQLAQLQPDAGRRYIYGHSLGGAVAVDLAAALSDGADGRDDARGGKLPASGLIIESSFTTLADMARALSYGWLPVQLVLTQKFDSVEKIARVRMPTLLVHGTSDRYVPARFSKTLYERATAPKKLLLVEGGSHNNSMRVGSAQYRAALNDLFGLGRQGQGRLSLAR